MRSCQIVKLWGVAYIWTRLIKLETNISDYCCASQSGVHPARVDRLSYRSLVLLRGQICNSINQLDVSLFGETDKSGNLTRLAFFTVLLYKHLIQHNNLLQNQFQHPWNRYVTWHNIAFFCAFHIAMRTHFSNRINLKLKIPLIEPSFSLGTLPFMRFLYSVLCSFLFSASTFRQR